jgi:extradiol dioxygenase family protein
MAVRLDAKKGAAPIPGWIFLSLVTSFHCIWVNRSRPQRHFGIVLPLPEWQQLAARLTAAGTQFVIAPTVRFQGEPGEQHTMFFIDPFGNPIEVKGFASIEAVYAH